MHGSRVVYDKEIRHLNTAGYNHLSDPNMCYIYKFESYFVNS